MSTAALKFAGIAIALCLAIGLSAVGASTSVADDGGSSSQTPPPPTTTTTTDGHTWDG